MSIRINAEYRKKHDAFNSIRSFEVEKIIELPMDEFESFRQDLLEPRSFIQDNAALMGGKDGGRHCLLVMGEGCNDGILVDSAGYDFAYYSAFLPNARQIVCMEQRYERIKDLENNLGALVDGIIAKAAASKNGEYKIPVDELAEKFMAENDTDIRHIIVDMLHEREEVSELDCQLGDGVAYLKIKRESQKPRPRLTEETLEIMCARHFLWLHDQVGGEQADFTGMDLSDHDLTFKKLDEAVFRDALMYNIEMKEGSFTGCDFVGADFSYTNAYAALFDECDFTGAKFEKSNFQRASMMNCDFHHADLCDSEFNNAVLDHSDLIGAKTGLADLTGTRVNHCTGLQAVPDEDEDQGMAMQ